MNNKTMNDYDYFMSGEEYEYRLKQSQSSFVIFLLTLNF